MTVIINDILCFDTDDLSGTNIAGKVMHKKAFDDYLIKSRIFVCDYTAPVFKDSLGICTNFRREGKEIYCDLKIYDVNGFDTEMPEYIIDGLADGAFKMRGLVKVIKLEGGIITEAEMVCMGLTYGA